MRGVLALAALTLLAPIVAGCGDDDEGDQPLIGYNEILIPNNDPNELLAESGASFVRVPINWTAVETQPGRLDFGRVDVVAKQIAELGLQPLWVVTSSPCWAAELPCSRQRPALAPAEEHLDAYADFVAAVAERYPDALGIEVWNEPNIPNFWRPAPDAARYRELLSLTAARVHESGSDVPVVMAGPSPTSAEQVADDPMKIQFAEFIEQVMSGPDRPDVDAIGSHPYSLLQRSADPIESTIALFDEARAAAERAAPGVPVWVTEVGLTTAGRYPLSVAAQAEGLKRIITTLADDGVPVIAIHRFFDQADPPFEFEAGFGVVEADQTTRKPSFCAVASAAGVDDCQT
jgi:polysaccharide biosynthesis protein PslG